VRAPELPLCHPAKMRARMPSYAKTTFFVANVPPEGSLRDVALDGWIGLPPGLRAAACCLRESFDKSGLLSSSVLATEQLAEIR
jgi:hypothetical protein